jgi:RNA polymerase sigma-70 factor (ECF subfamily)
MSQFGEQLRFFAYRITNNKEISEEIVSESFYKLWQGREKAVSVEAIKSFLYLITRNACYDYTGSAYQRRTVLEQEYVLDREVFVPDILSHIIYAELIGQIVAELENLPKQQAEVFRMSYLEGMKTEEICEKLGTSATSVYFARSKALSTLRMAFKEKNISLYSALLIFSLSL